MRFQVLMLHSNYPLSIFPASALAVRDSTTHIWCTYHDASRTVSVFTRNLTEIREEGRFVPPSFPERSRCSRFSTTRNSLMSLLANTGAEVAYFNRVGINQTLIIKGKYVRANTSVSTEGGGCLVKLVIADSRLSILGFKPGEFIHRTQNDVRFTRIDKYETSDIASGTLIVFVTANYALTLERTRIFINGWFEIPLVLARRVRTVYKKMDKCPTHIRTLVEYIDLCMNPIVDGPPDQEAYFDEIWISQDTRMIMDQLIVGAEVYDQGVLSNIFGLIGTSINAHLDENLSLLAPRLGFIRAT